MFVFLFLVYFIENKIDEFFNNIGKVKSYFDDGGICYFLFFENQKIVIVENRNIVSEVFWDFYMD